MATVNNVVVANLASISPGSTLIFPQIWRLTRALKKAGWKYIASGNGTSKDAPAAPGINVLGNPAADLWNSTPGVAGTSTGLSGSSASIASPTRGRATVSGLSGITAADKGRFLVISGGATSANNNAHQIEEILSSSSVRVDARTFAVTSDPLNGSLSWVIQDPNESVVPTILAPNSTGNPSPAAWWCARGPSIIRIPITAAPVAGGSSGLNFLRGENVVQTSTGAEGELRGWVFDSTLNTGYLVIYPRLRGTGTGVYGWDTGNLITGSLTGATVTHDGTAKEYRAEIVVWKVVNTYSQGSLFMGWFDPSVDFAGTGMFSDASRLSTATATTAPGGSGANFPGFAWAFSANNTTNAVNTWWLGNRDTANAQISVVDCIEEKNYSADGSWNFAVAHTALTGGAYDGMCFQVLDDGEDGDLCPYVTGRRIGGTLYSTSYRTSSSSGYSYNSDTYTNASTFFGASGSSDPVWGSWYRRGLTAPIYGLTSADLFVNYEVVREFAGQTNAVLGSSVAIDPETIATAPVYTKLRVPIRIVHTPSGVEAIRKHRKGTLRHMWFVQGGQGNDTYESRKYIQLSGQVSNHNVVVEPWDGVTTPFSY